MAGLGTLEELAEVEKRIEKQVPKSLKEQEERAQFHHKELARVLENMKPKKAAEEQKLAPM